MQALAYLAVQDETDHGHAGIDSLSIALGCDEEALQQTLRKLADKELLSYTPDGRLDEDEETIDARPPSASRRSAPSTSRCGWAVWDRSSEDGRPTDQTSTTQSGEPDLGTGTGPPYSHMFALFAATPRIDRFRRRAV